jgi:hypothetical protein
MSDADAQQPEQAEPAPAPEAQGEAEAPAEAPQAAEAPQPQAEAPAEAPQAEEAPQPQAQAPAAGDGAPKPKGARKRRPRKPRRPVPDLPKTRAPLPLDELRDASRSTLQQFGRDGVRDAFAILGPKERSDISNLIAGDEDHRPRARNIANGSLGAGRIDKAMAATMLSMAQREDLWSVTLDKEMAAQKLGRVRAAKQRDERRTERARERSNRADRVSREDLKKAQDGRVGATIRFVTADDKRERRSKKKDEPPAHERGSVLDKLGY